MTHTHTLQILLKDTVEKIIKCKKRIKQNGGIATRGILMYFYLLICFRHFLNQIHMQILRTKTNIHKYRWSILKIHILYI